MIDMWKWPPFDRDVGRHVHVTLSVRPSSNVDHFMFRTLYLFSSTQTVQVRRLIKTSNLISPTIFTMFIGLKCLQVKTNSSNLYIRFGTLEVRRLKRSRSTVEIPMWDLNSRVDPKLDMSNLIDLNLDLFMYLIEGVRSGMWKDRRLNWA